MGRQTGLKVSHGSRSVGSALLRRLGRVVVLVCIVAAAEGLSVRPARADMWVPSRDRITFYFDLNGEPQNRPVDFVIRCYGYDPHMEDWTAEELADWLASYPKPVTAEPGSYQIEEVYTRKGSCPGYGCWGSERHGSLDRFMQIDYCDLEGAVGGNQFTVAKYAYSNPFAACPGGGHGEESMVRGWFARDYCVQVNIPLPDGGTDRSLAGMLKAIMVVAGAATHVTAPGHTPVIELFAAGEEGSWLEVRDLFDVLADILPWAPAWNRFPVSLMDASAGLRRQASSVLSAYPTKFLGEQTQSAPAYRVLRIDIDPPLVRMDRFLMALVITIAVEVLVVFLLARLAFGMREVSGWRIVLSAILASSVTLPLLWFVFPMFIAPRYFVFVGELLVFVIEAILYKVFLRTSFGRAAALSFVANALSFLLGLIIF